MIAEALRRTGGNQSRAALLLGICRNTLAEKLRRLGIRAPEESSPRSGRSDQEPWTNFYDPPR